MGVFLEDGRGFRITLGGEGIRKLWTHPSDSSSEQEIAGYFSKLEASIDAQFV